jgi:hypothetical protein
MRLTSLRTAASRVLTSAINSGNWIYDLPFGENRRFAQKGAASHIFMGGSGRGFYSRERPAVYHSSAGRTLDIQRGVAGRATLGFWRIDHVSNPTSKEWFNTAAFCQPETTANNPDRDVRECLRFHSAAGRNIL